MLLVVQAAARAGELDLARADGSRAPLIILLHHEPAVVSAVAAETLTLVAKP